MASPSSKVPVEELGEIYHETVACILAFENCLLMGPLMEEGWAENRLADMKLWASSVGALSHPRSSLDRRLEFQLNPRLVLLSLLRTLQEFVQICHMIASAQSSEDRVDGNSGSQEAMVAPMDRDLVQATGSDSDSGRSSPAPSATARSDLETDSPTSTDSNDPEASEEDRLQKMLRKGMRNTEDVLDQLMMLGIAIRKSGTAARLHRADNSFHPDHLNVIRKLLGDPPWHLSDGSKLALVEQQWRTLVPSAVQCPSIAYIQQVQDLQIFREHLNFVLFHDARRQQNGDKKDEGATSRDRMKEARGDPSELSPEQNHLVLANLRRRHRFAYARRHQQKFDKSVVPRTEPRVVAAIPVPGGVDGLPEKSPPQIVTDPDVPAESAPKAIPSSQDSFAPLDISETDPSVATSEILKPEALVAQDTQSRVSVSTARQNYPAPPPQIEGRKWFKCPCCSQTLPEMFRDKGRWRKHLSEDLCPYTCPFQDCRSPAVLYISSAAWREHVLGTHGTSDWECLYCAGTETPNTFATTVELASHTKACHDDTISEEQIMYIQNSCRRILPPDIPTCPLCPWPRGLTVEPDAAANLEHVGNCIHEFSLRALPWAEFFEEQTSVPAERSTIAKAKSIEWLATTKEEMDEDDVEDLSIEGVSIQVIRIQNVNIKKIDITSFHFLPALAQPEARDRSYLPQDYFDEHSNKSSRAQRASSTAGSNPNKATSDAAPPRPRSPITNAKDSLKSFLLALLEKNFDEEDFLPADSIYDLTREELVRQAISHEGAVVEEDMVSFASGPGKRTFLTLVYCDGLGYLESIFSSGFDDQNLPLLVDRSEIEAMIDSGLTSNYKVSKHDVTLQGFYSMPMSHIARFFDLQWDFLAPVFSSDQFLYQLHDRQPLPFVQHSREHFSRSINQVRIHPAHFPMLDISVEPVMALSVTNEDPRRQGFGRDVANLQDMQNLKSDHILKPFAAFEQHGSLYKLMPWANGGTLSDFWRRRQGLVDGPEPPARMVVLWMLEQMCGLAHAISALHESMLKHRDLTPYAILVVKDDEPLDLGTLKINCVDKPRSQITEDRSASVSISAMEGVYYKEPELSSLSDESTSRSADMWSIGCIFLDFLVWVLSGNVGLREVQGERQRHYWDVKYGHSQVDSAAVDSWLSSTWTRLENYFGETQGALWDLLCVIRDGLLVVDRSKRMNGKRLYRTLAEVHQKARESPGYLYDPNIWYRKQRAASATLIPTLRRRAPELSQDEIKSPFGVASKHDSPLVPVSVQVQRIIDQLSPDSHKASRSILRDLFAEHILRNIDWPLEPQADAPVLCERCEALDLCSLDLQFERTSVYLLDHKQRCDFCRVLYREELWIEREDDPILFRREGPYIRADPGGDIECVVYADPEFLDQRLPQTLPGLPMLPQSGSPRQTFLLREWLQACDRDHDCFRPKEYKADDAFPFIRLLDLGADHSASVRLSTLKSESSQIHCRYAALSYVWGHGGGHEFGTRRANLREYRQGIRDSHFPASVRDAIRITRNLGIQYLWVDAFCIIQDDIEEWQVAVRRMDRVFGSAYCRLAAASSSTAYEGMIVPRASPTHLRLRAPEGPSIYISKFIDNFHRDVDGSPLNRRAWVLQERALCCRTIYFTTTQVYMECGEGVRCETLGRISWENASFLGDSHFPRKALRYFRGSGILLYQNLYAHYTTLDLSVRKDRLPAIAPLETRVARELDTVGAYGILARYLASSLMWTRKSAEGVFRIQSSWGPKTPSWSWMAYDGSIEYLSNASEMEVTSGITAAFRSFFDRVLADQPMPNDGVEITVPARRLSRAEIALVRPKGLVLDEPLGGHSQMFDDHVLCISVATEKDKSRDSEVGNWIILIAPAVLEPGDEGLTQAYQRIGAGIVSEDDMAAETVFVTLR